MRIKNVKKVNDNELILDMEHPVYGWIPYTALRDTDDDTMNIIFEEAYPLANSYDINILSNRVISKFDTILTEMVNENTRKYSQEEMDMFTIKRLEANKVLNGETSEMLELEASITNENVIDLANKIINKNNELSKVTVIKRNILKNLQEELKTSTTYDQIVDIENKYSKILKDM